MARVQGVEEPGFGLTRLVYGVVKRTLGRVVRPVRIHALVPPLLRGYALMEGGQRGADGVAAALKSLARLRAATRIGCPF